MTAFLDRFAKEFIRQTEGEPDHYGVVLPNRRAGLFFKRYLAGYITKPIWLPAIFSVEDFILHLSGLQIMDPVELLYQLYQVHREVERQEAQSFDDFINWGKDLIRDFNEMDQYLADPHALFSYLTEARAISVWNLNHEPLTPFQQKYIKFYQSLESYYTLFSAHLLEKRKVYQGLAYRRLAETIQDVSANLPWKKVFFAGFNALTTAEQRIIEYLFTRDQAVLYWDADSYYMDDPEQEAGRFLRPIRNLSSFGPFQWIETHFRSPQKDITITGIPKNVGQAKMAGTILAGWQEEKVLSEETAIVLIDENLLLPVLNSLPDSIQDFNITMGYPLKNTPVYDLVEAVMVLHENGERFSGLVEQAGWRYYHTDVYRILNHPCVMGMVDNADAVREEIARLMSRNIVFFGDDFLRKVFEKIDPVFWQRVSIVFTRWKEGISDALECLQHLMETLRDVQMAVPDKESRIELEYIYHFARLIVRLRSVQDQYPVSMKTRTLHNLIRQLATMMALPFYGEPLKGIQIMGMLETRNLDFRNLILLSVNEDLLPAGKHSHSFIPLDIRLECGLPTYHDHDAVFAYHFYRLLQRAERIHLLYNTEPTELGGGEQSRFITQLQHELPVYNPAVTIRSSLATLPPLVLQAKHDVVVEKNDTVLARLIRMAQEGFTPTSLNSYRSCSLQFYLRHVARISIPEELEETIDARTMGSVIHEVLRTLYAPFLDQVVTSGDIVEMVRRTDELTLECFRRIYPENDIRYGKNLLIVNISKVLIRNYLNWEKDWLQDQDHDSLSIRLLEEYISSELEIPFRGEPLRIRIMGKPDRIDVVGGTYRIIDYKTGSVRKTDLSLKSWERLITDPAADKIFQVLFYGYLFHSLHPESKAGLDPGIISLRAPRAGLMTVNFPDKATLTGSIPRIRDVIHEILQRIYDPRIPFRRTEEIKTCEYCSFKGICIR
ncbi:MAG: PD-(D/E)XK nuclease family protein [Bacteroidales bacterium]|nr:PD-(D/E)XK nuclease family protein [Lentimicrobiaceae bacterium]MDD5694152.1 PD-(D/E)XK nuclease family protein [Bacteroidales bacterium]